MNYALSVAMEETARFFGDIKATLRFWREIRRQFPDVCMDRRILDTAYAMASTSIDRVEASESSEAHQ